MEWIGPPYTLNVLCNSNLVAAGNFYVFLFDSKCLVLVRHVPQGTLHAFTLRLEAHTCKTFTRERH